MKKQNPYKVGDKVKILRDIKDSYHEIWHEKGDVLEVVSIDGDGEGLFFSSQLGIHFTEVEPVKKELEDQDEWDADTDEDSEDELDTPKLVKVKNIKEKKEKKEKKAPRDPIKYENQEMVSKFDDMVEEIKGDKKSNEYRDHFFPMLIDKLNLKNGVEIGVDKAEFSLHILSKSKIESYYCVDTWQDSFGSDCRPGFFDRDGNKRLLAAQKELNPHSKRVKMLRMTSLDAASKFKDGTLDFCYIDGDHSLEGIYDDIKAWLPKVKIGGIVAGHDYKDGPRSGINDFFGRQLPYKIKSVMDDFCARHGYPLRVIGGRILSWYFIKNRNG